MSYLDRCNRYLSPITFLVLLLSACTMNYQSFDEDDYFNKRLNECSNLISANKPDESLTCATRLVIDFPDSSLAYNLRSGIYYRKGEYIIALKDIEKAINLDSDNPEFYRNRGILYSRIPGKQNLAIAEFDKAIDMNPKDPICYEWRSLIYNMMNNTDLALRDINEAIRLNQKNPNAYNSRAGLYYALNQQEEALSDCYQAVALNPKSAESYDLMGIITFNKGEIDKAISQFNKSIEIASEMPYSYSNRSSAYWVKGRRKEATEDLKKAVQLDPKFAMAYFKLGYVMDQEKNQSNARAYFKRAAELDPNIANFAKKASEFTNIPQIRAYYSDMSGVAARYIKDIPPSSINSPRMLSIDKVATEPVKLKTGIKFDIIVDYTISDKASDSEMLPVKFSLTIEQKGQTIFTSETMELESKNGSTNRRIQHMNATNKKGSYVINITMQYSDITKIQKHKVTIN
jgi:tetratricopeptide (TPR) repeat protein